MNAIAQFVRTTIVGGLLFLAPIVVLIVILAKAFDYAKKGLDAGLVYFPAAYELSAGAATALSVVLVALLCFLAGLLARTVPAQHIINALESSVLSKIPAYEYLKQESASALGAAQSTDLPVVFVPMEGGWQLGLQTEPSGDGLVPVFVPGAPNPHSGSVFFFPADIIRPAGVELSAALSYLRRCGAGAFALSANWPAAHKCRPVRGWRIVQDGVESATSMATINNDGFTSNPRHSIARDQRWLRVRPKSARFSVAGEAASAMVMSMLFSQARRH